MSRARIGEKVEVLRNRGIDGWETRVGQIVGITRGWRPRYEILILQSGSVGVYKRREFIRTRLRG